MERRARLVLPAVFLALSTAGALALPFIVERVPDWAAHSWSDKLNLLMGLLLGACALGVWRLQVALDWGRRTWKARALIFLLAPCFLLPAWIGLFVLDPAFDPEVALRPRELPGYRVALPDWQVAAESDDFWSGELKLHRSGGEQVIVRWNPGDDVDPAQITGSFQLGEPLESASSTVAGRKARTVYRRVGGWIAGFSVLGCGDGRALLLSSSAEKLESVRRFHQRLLATVACVAAARPELAWPTVALDGFRLQARSPSGATWLHGDESVQVSPITSAPAFTELEHDLALRRAVGVGMAGLLGLKTVADGASTRYSTAEGERWLWSAPLAASDGGARQISFSAWHCADGWVLAAYLGSDGTRAPDRLRAVTCPPQK